jgi:hypothetical protein
MHPVVKFSPIVVIGAIGVGVVLRDIYEQDKIKEKLFEEALVNMLAEEERKKRQSKN